MLQNIIIFTWFVLTLGTARAEIKNIFDEDEKMNMHISLFKKGSDIEYKHICSVNEYYPYNGKI